MAEMPENGSTVTVHAQLGQVFTQGGVPYVSAITYDYVLSKYHCPLLSEMTGNMIAYTGTVLTEADLVDAGGGNKSLQNVNAGDVYRYNGSYYISKATADWQQPPSISLDNWIEVLGSLA